MAGKQEAEVLFEYEKTQDDELNLKVGEIIHDVVQADEGWCEGTLNGVRGMFPDNFVKIRPVQTQAPAQPPPPAETKTPVRETGGAIKNRRAKVTFSYAAENSDELSLEPGQIVEIIAEEEEGWYKGKLNGKVGVFPSNFLGDDVPVAEAAPVNQEPAPPKPEEPAAPKQPVGGQKLFGSINPALARAQLKSSAPHAPPEKKPAPPPPASNTHKPPPEKPAEKKAPLEKAKVTFDYDADNDDELTIRMGDVLEIVNKETDQDGWWKVKLGGKVGLIPDNFVELIPPGPAPSHAPPPAAKAKGAPPPPSDHRPPPKEVPSKPLPPRSGSVSRPAPPQPERPPPPAEPKAPPPVKEEPTEENSDFGVPHTDPLDSSAVKNRPKKTSRPPSRSNLHMDEVNNAEPPPEPKPEKPATPSAGLSPWQAELQKRKAHKPQPAAPTAKPARKPAVKPPAADKPAVKPPPPSRPQPSVKPHADPTPQPPREQSPSPHPPSVSPTPTSTPAHASTPSHTAAAAAPPDDSWKESYEKLRDEFDKFKEYVKEQFAMLTNDLDDERKHWRGMEVDIDRLKKRNK